MSASNNNFTDHELRGMITGNNPQSNAYRELLASREAQNKPVAYIFQHPAGKLFWAITDDSNAGTDGVIPVFSALPKLPSIGCNSVNEAAWRLHDTLLGFGPITAAQFNNIKGCFYEALEVFYKEELK